MTKSVRGFEDGVQWPRDRAREISQGVDLECGRVLTRLEREYSPHIYPEIKEGRYVINSVNKHTRFSPRIDDISPVFYTGEYVVNIIFSFQPCSWLES